MDSLDSIIGPQLRLVQRHERMQVPERRLPDEAEAERYSIYTTQPATSTLPLCPTCLQPHGGTLHGWRKKAHGPETNWKTVFEPCPTCSPAAIALQHEEKARQAQVSLEKVFGDAQIPWYAREWEFENFPTDGDQKAKLAMQTFMAKHLHGGDTRSKRGLYLGGDVGRGKTSLAISALKQVIREAQQPCLYVMSMELMDRLRATYNQDQGISYDELINAVTAVTWLVLDDLAVERPSVYVLEKLHYLIEKRRAQGLYTIITSNLTTQALQTYWKVGNLPEGSFQPGTRVIERIREYCDGIFVTGRNQREGNW